MDNAKSCNGCSGCQHMVEIPDGLWCYMFKDSPKDLPCYQHDMFYNQRQATGKLVRSNPQLLALMIMGMSNH